MIGLRDRYRRSFIKNLRGIPVKYSYGGSILLIVLSPAKTLKFDSVPPTHLHSMPDFLDESEILIARLRQFSPQNLSALMHISGDLAVLNVTRYAAFKRPFTYSNARPALLAFKGDVYRGMSVNSYSESDFIFAQKHLRILSGLYGVLRPMDLIQPYRLEMKTALTNPRGKNLYEFWGELITRALNESLSSLPHPCLINLASNEYFKAIKPKLLQAPIVTPVFKQKHKGTYKVVAVHAKRARGLMSEFVIRNRLTEAAQLKNFAMENYGFDPALSDEKSWVFTRS